MTLYIKRETTSSLSVLTAVQYQHPQQRQDDKASVLLLDTVDMVVVVNGLDFSRQCAVLCHIQAYFTIKISSRGSFSITTSTFQKSPQSVS